MLITTMFSNKGGLNAGIVTSQQDPPPLTGLASSNFVNVSIKRRLFRGKSKSSKRRTYSRHRKTNNLKTDNVVINLSEHPLNLNELSVLALASYLAISNQLFMRLIMIYYASKES